LQKLSLIDALLFLIDFISDPVNTIPETYESCKMNSNFAFLLVILTGFFIIGHYLKDL